MSRVVVTYHCGAVEVYAHVEHFRVSDDELSLFINHHETVVPLIEVCTFDVKDDRHEL